MEQFRNFVRLRLINVHLLLKVENYLPIVLGALKASFRPCKAKESK